MRCPICLLAASPLLGAMGLALTDFFPNPCPSHAAADAATIPGMRILSRAIEVKVVYWGGPQVRTPNVDITVAPTKIAPTSPHHLAWGQGSWDIKSSTPSKPLRDFYRLDRFHRYFVPHGLGLSYIRQIPFDHREERLCASQYQRHPQ